VSGRKRQGRHKGRTRPRVPADLRQVDWEAVGWARIDRCLARFEAGPLVVLLAAAADSPGGGHRLPSLTVLWLRCLARPPTGEVSASPGHLTQLLAAAGVTAMIVASAQVRGATLSADLGKAETIITQLGFPWREDDTPYETSEFARWHLTQAGVEHLERVRDGGNLALSITPEVVLLNHGESVPGLYPRPEGVHRPNTTSHSPIRHTGQEQLDVPAETWARQVLTLAAGRRRHPRRQAPLRNGHRRPPHRDPGPHRRTAAPGRG